METAYWDFGLANVFLYVMMLILSSLIVYGRDFPYISGVERIVRGIVGLVILAGLITAYNLYFYFSSAEDTDDRQATVSEALEHFGLTPGEKYPLTLGDRITGSVGEGSLNGAFGFVSGSGQIKPGSALTISYKSQGRTYLIEPIASNISYIENSDSEPTIEIYIKDGDAPSVGEIKYTYGECEVVFRDMVFQCVKDVTAEEYLITAEEDRRGPGSIIANHFDSAVVTLTPDMFKQVIGQN